MGLLKGILGNYSEVPKEQLVNEYGCYLMDGETIELGFKLIRDALIFTDKRLIFTDKQGATGSKMRVVSVNIDSIVSVTMETSGFGFDDSELTFTYITNAYLKAHDVAYASKKLEFPKKFDVQSLYKLFQTIAYENYKKLNA